MTGPKSYGYLINTGKEVLKIKGFTLNHKNSEHLNLKSLQKNYRKKVDKVNLSYKTITRNVQNKTLVNTETNKEFRFVYNKRMVLPEKQNTIDTLLCGY